jgi:hypothetical protein
MKARIASGVSRTGAMGVRRSRLTISRSTPEVALGTSGMAAVSKALTSRV